MIEKSQISNTVGKIVIEEIMFNDTTPQSIVEEKGLAQISDSLELMNIVNEIVSKNQKALEDYKNGKTNVLGFLVGQCMKASKGKGNPEMLKQMIIDIIA